MKTGPSVKAKSPGLRPDLPTDALVFGNLMDRDSRVAALRRPRAYQAMGYSIRSRR